MKNYTLETVERDKCYRCKYRNTCAGLRSEVRMDCGEADYGRNPDSDYSSKWDDMSYYGERIRARRSWQQRLRDGE